MPGPAVLRRSCTLGPLRPVCSPESQLPLSRVERPRSCPGAAAINGCGVQELKAGDTVQITVTAEPGSVPVPNRLRMSLKVLLRSYGLRCTDVRQIAAAPNCEQQNITVKGADRADEIPNHP